MILTQYVMRKGRRVPVSELGHASRFKVEVMCPECDAVRVVHYRSIVAAGHHRCHACVMKEQAVLLHPGTQYGRLTVISPAESAGVSLCECICGNFTEVRNRNLTSGMTRSCGCLKKESFQDAVKVRGPAHGMWRGGVSSQRKRVMQSAAYKEWREAVFSRDKYTCQRCKRVGRDLNAHHIEDFSSEPSKRLDIENGLTLCTKCHEQFHCIYGRNDTTTEQLSEFLLGG